MTSVGAPRNRTGHEAIWTGDTMLVVGGSEGSAILPDAVLFYQLTRPLFLYGRR